MDAEDKLEKISESVHNIDIKVSRLVERMETLCGDNKDLKSSQGRQWLEINFNSFFRKSVTAFLMVSTPSVLIAMVYIVKKLP